MKKSVAVGSNSLDAYDRIKAWFESFGYTVLDKPAPQDNGCDMYVVGKKRALRVEIKLIREIQSGSWQAANITDDQKNYDAVALMWPNGQVFVEDMESYLKSCSNEGYRQFTWMKL